MRPDESCGISSYLSSFMPTTTDEITKLVSKSACKSCKLDPIPTHLLKSNLSCLAPVIADIVSMSIATGVFPSAFKKALVTPLLKKTTFDANVFKCTEDYHRNVQWCLVFRKVSFSALSCLFATQLHSVVSHVDTG